MTFVYLSQSLFFHFGYCYYCEGILLLVELFTAGVEVAWDGACSFIQWRLAVDGVSTEHT